MSEVVEKTKYFISNVSQDEGIRGLIKLQAEAPDKMKHIPRLACLSLMQMCHDWQGIRKFLVQWRLAPKFGSQLVIRMRKRVGEEPGTPIDDASQILKQLDRLNDKNWRQFSPKRNLPDYAELLANQKEQKKKQVPVAISNPLPTIIQQRQTQQFSKKSNNAPQIKNRPSIFSKISHFQKNDANVQKDILPKGVFSKQISQKSLNLDKNQGKSDQNFKNSNLILKKEVDSQPKQKNASQDFNNGIKKIQYNKSLSPIKEIPKKVISLKYGNQKQKIIQESAKDEFSFSAVKYKQNQGLSNKKQQSAGKVNELDDSFLNFVNQSKIMKGRNEQIAYRNDKILEQAGIIGKQSYRNSAKYKQAKALYSKQQLALINSEVAAENNIRKIMKAEGKLGLDILKARLIAN